MILKITEIWVRVLEATVDNLDPNRQIKQEIREKMSELEGHLQTIKNLKEKQGT